MNVLTYFNRFYNEILYNRGGGVVHDFRNDIFIIWIKISFNVFP